MTEDNSGILALTAEIVSAHCGNNSMSATEVPALIKSVYDALATVENPAPVEAAKPVPAVPIRSSIKQDYIVCLEDGTKLKMLRRYLRTNFNMTPEEYRAKWNLPRDYPMVAPAYAEQRKQLAVRIGLGRKKGETAPNAVKKAGGKPKKAPAEAKAAAVAHLNPNSAKAEVQ